MSSSRNNLDEELAQNIAIGDEPGIEVIPFSDGPEVRPTEFGPSLGIQVIRTGHEHEKYFFAADKGSMNEEKKVHILGKEVLGFRRRWIWLAVVLLGIAIVVIGVAVGVTRPREVSTTTASTSLSPNTILPTKTITTDYYIFTSESNTALPQFPQLPQLPYPMTPANSATIEVFPGGQGPF